MRSSRPLRAAVGAEFIPNRSCSRCANPWKQKAPGRCRSLTQGGAGLLWVSGRRLRYQIRIVTVRLKQLSSPTATRPAQHYPQLIDAVKPAPTPRRQQEEPVRAHPRKDHKTTERADHAAALRAILLARQTTAQLLPAASIQRRLRSPRLRRRARPILSQIRQLPPPLATKVVKVALELAQHVNEPRTPPTSQPGHEVKVMKRRSQHALKHRSDHPEHL